MMSERRFSALLGSIYEAAEDFARWPEALRGIAQAYNAPAVVFAAVGADGEALWNLAPGTDDSYTRKYVDYYHSINPIIPRATPNAVGAVLTDEMMIERREFSRCEFFNDFLKPQEVGSMLGSAVYARDGLYCAISVQRRRRFGEEEIALHRRLAPHLLRAVQLNVKLSALDRRACAAVEALDLLPQAAVVVDACACVLFANREAERLTGPLGCLRISRGVLEGRFEAITARLKALIAGCAAPKSIESGGALQLPCEDGRRAMPAQVLPLRGEAPAFSLAPRPAAVVFITDPGRAEAHIEATLRRRFGLTATEAAFAREIAKGDGLQATADRLGVKLSTARTHLAHVFEKTYSRRQAELARLVVSLGSA